MWGHLKQCLNSFRQSPLHESPFAKMVSQCFFVLGQRTYGLVQILNPSRIEPQDLELNIP